MRYKRIVLTRIGEPEALELREEELPAPKADEVRIKVLAAGVSYAALAHTILEKYQVQGNSSCSLIPCRKGAGIHHNRLQ